MYAEERHDQDADRTPLREQQEQREATPNLQDDLLGSWQLAVGSWQLEIDHYLQKELGGVTESQLRVPARTAATSVW